MENELKQPLDEEMILPEAVKSNIKNILIITTIFISVCLLIIAIVFFRFFYSPDISNSTENEIQQPAQTLVYQEQIPVQTQSQELIKYNSNTLQTLKLVAFYLFLSPFYFLLSVLLVTVSRFWFRGFFWFW